MEPPERIAASTHILMCLERAKTICFAATHDIELARLLEDFFDNYHFEEEVKDGDVLFSYRLLEGRAQTRNAISQTVICGFNVTYKLKPTIKFFAQPDFIFINN